MGATYPTTESDWHRLTCQSNRPDTIDVVVGGAVAIERKGDAERSPWETLWSRAREVVEGVVDTVDADLALQGVDGGADRACRDALCAGCG